MGEIISAYKKAQKAKNKPTAIIAKTLKGKGVSFLEDKNGWHGKAPDEEKLKVALEELGEVDQNIRGEISNPSKAKIKEKKFKPAKKLPEYKIGEEYPTRKAYGNAISRIFPKYKDMVVLDAEVSNSTHADIFKNHYPERFFEMFIAEQNMVGTALGFSRRGKIPFVSTFSAFFSRAYDQIRMSQYSGGNIKFVGSHAGVSIGEDGASQMGLEDISMFRSLRESAVLYPSDAVSAEALVELSAKHKGNVYIRTTRMATPVIYKKSEKFAFGGSKTLRKSGKDEVTVIGAGVTLFEALKAYDELKKEGINIRVIDLYSIKPLDIKTLKKSAKETRSIIVVEDHYEAGGIGEAVSSALAEEKASIHSLCVRKEPMSGKPEELMDYEEISAKAIIKKVKSLIRK
jgi:transketolase